MFFNLRSQSIKKYFIILFFGFFVFSSLAQVTNGENYDPFVEEEDILCKDIPEALDKHNKNVQLSTQAVKVLVLEISKFLSKSSEAKVFKRGELNDMLQNLDEVYSMIQENEYVLLNRGDDIHYFLEECLKN